MTAEEAFAMGGKAWEDGRTPEPPPGLTQFLRDQWSAGYEWAKQRWAKRAAN